MNTKMTTLRTLLQADVNTWEVAKEIYYLGSTEASGTQIYVSKEGGVKTLDNFNIPNNADGSWDGWYFVCNSKGEIPSEWEIEQFHDENDNLKYRDGADTEAKVFDSEEDCFTYLLEEYGLPAEFYDEIMDTPVENDE